MKIRIPLLVLGPYLSPILIWSILLSTIITVALFICSGLTQIPANRDYLFKAAETAMCFFIFLVAVFLLLRVLGMP